MKKRQRTEKSKYKHQTTGDYCTCAAYIAEAMCLRMAQYNNKGSLPYMFWNKKPWRKSFKRQLMLAIELIDSYGETALIKTIQSTECNETFSLNAPRLRKALKKYQPPVKKKEAQSEPLKHKTTTKRRIQSYGKLSPFNKLRSLDLDAKENKG